MITIRTLSNGIKAAIYTDTSVHSFHLRLHVKGGSLVETKKNNGVAHFMEHMLVQGIPSYPSAELLSAFVESIAGRYGAFTSKITVSFEITVPTKEVKNACEIASQVFFEPLFPENSLEKERIAVLNEIQQKYDSQQYKMSKFFQKVRYKKNSRLLFDTGGSVPSVQKLTRDDLQTYWEKYFRPDNTFIIVVSSLKEEEVVTLLEIYFGKYKNTKNNVFYFPNITEKEFNGKKIVAHKQKDYFVNYVDISFPAVSLKEDLSTRLKHNILVTLLGRLRTSRLFKLLRYQKGLVYGVSSSNTMLPEIGTTYISSEVENSYLDEVIQLIIKTLDSFLTEGPTDEELTLIKHYLSNSWQMTYDYPDAVAGWIESGLLWEKKVYLPDDYIPFLEQITKKDLLAMMKQHWDLDKINLVIQGPMKADINLELYKSLLDKISKK